MSFQAQQAPSYPKGDLRRMLVVIAAIAERKDGATLVQIAARTGLDNKTVTNLIRQAGEQAAVKIEKAGAVYVLRDIGPVFKKSGVNLSLTGALNAL